MSACGKCGHQNPAGGRFCSECGTPLPEGCPKCTFAGSPPGSKFCSQCGGPLGGAPPRPAPAPPPGARPAMRPTAGRPGVRPPAAARGGPPQRPRPGPPPSGGPPKSPHALERVGGTPLVLVSGQPFTFGREECSLNIPSQRVSRRHAEITWTGDAPVLTDLGSSNGTTVNGKRLTKPHTLQDGDEISIGPYLCTYRDLRKGPSPAKDMNMLTAPMLSDAMAGRLDQVSLFELLQTLELNQKTGVLEVFGGDVTGSIGLREGKPIYAEAEGQSGVEAIYLLVRETEGQFTFGPGFDAARAPEISTSMGAILMEASRRQDEGNR